MKTRYGRNGLLLGSLGMLAFSGTLPATRLAVPAFGPTVLTCSRIVIAGLLGAAALLLVRGKRRPELRHVAGIAWSGLVWTGLDWPWLGGRLSSVVLASMAVCVRSRIATVDRQSKCCANPFICAPKRTRVAKISRSKISRSKTSRTKVRRLSSRLNDDAGPF